VICGKSIKKKDSVMAIDYVCSDSCKQQRKQQQPKKISITSLSYWTNSGMSIEEAKQQVSLLQKKRSKRCVDYWINHGFSHEEARIQVKEHQSKIGKKNLEKYNHYERQQRTPFSVEYWINKGFSRTESEKIIKENSDCTSLNYHISKYGKDEGTHLYKLLCETRKREYTLSGFKKKYGDIEGQKLWSKKYKNRHNSKKACMFFEKLISIIGEEYKIYSALTSQGEYGILDKENNMYYFYDFVVPSLNLCVEFHGDYWHCNPTRYSDSYVVKQTGLLASEIWDRDRKKQNCLKTERNINTIVVWESDDKEHALTYIMEKVNEFKESKN
jgi:G:T-mismatch repair DNA endonuclease (very short patch repair protein)